MASWHKASGEPLTVEHLRKIIEYDSETGHFRWLLPRAGRKSRNQSGIGSSPGGTGGRVISIDGKLYSTARLAWLHHFGEWPKGTVNHINRDKADDRIDNLEDYGVARIDFSQNTPITAERLRALVTYDPETGLFRWKQRPGRSGVRAEAGRIVSPHSHDGYLIARIDRRAYRQHRLAFLYMTGHWPEPPLVVDHVNGNKADNRWSNLRLATKAENSRNSVGRRNARTVPYKGTSKGKDGRWTARITLNLGTFDTPEEASAAYAKAARHHYGEFANAGRGAPSVQS